MLLLILVLLSAEFSLQTNTPDLGYLIACHTSDFECFKRQYEALRDEVFLGNHKFLIDQHEPFMFKFINRTCIQLLGIKESQLVAISLNGAATEFTITLKMPLKMQQLKEVDEKNVTRFCSEIDQKFEDVQPDDGKLKSFTGNVTARVIFPYRLHKKRYTYLYLGDEDVDLILDIADLSQYKDKSGEQGRMYLMSEWAYEVIQHVDVAQLFLLPYTGKIRTGYQRIPLEKLILLYPEEQYSNIMFSYSDLKE